MPSEQRQKVKFTGKRTGLEAIRVKGYGLVEKGQTIETSVEEAERWTTPHPTRDGSSASDFSKVGGSYKKSEEKVAATEEAQREKLAGNVVVDVEEAHETDPDGGTAEEDAEDAKEASEKE
jgi:hypothetical protein